MGIAFGRMNGTCGKGCADASMVVDDAEDVCGSDGGGGGGGNVAEDGDGRGMTFWMDSAMNEAAKSSSETAADSVLTTTSAASAFAPHAVPSPAPESECSLPRAEAIPTSAASKCGGSTGVGGSGDSELPLLDTTDGRELSACSRRASCAFVSAMASSSLRRRASRAACAARAISSSTAGADASRVGAGEGDAEAGGAEERADEGGA